ncbi:dynein axonemal heavy chain 11-like isoform X2 [Zonotrichia leucophrys gambelii]|uniref:dynein axonemal heavy chain 11-like isoform X2 n=1 Tax=Zonotrichia leucophrys gambelii TaxID=257770 RepID=UPI00314018E4
MMLLCMDRHLKSSDEIAQLNALINMLLRELTPGDHQNIMTICTIDVHARDVVATVIAQKLPRPRIVLLLCVPKHPPIPTIKSHC